jgi:hypothetical protein
MNGGQLMAGVGQCRRVGSWHRAYNYDGYRWGRYDGSWARSDDYGYRGEPVRGPSVDGPDYYSASSTTCRFSYPVDRQRGGLGAHVPSNVRRRGRSSFFRW